MAAEAIESGQEARRKGRDIEESLCLFMQVTLPQECGYTAKTARVSDQLNDAPLKKKICQALEQEWTDYLSQPKKYPTIVDYLLHCTIKTTEAQ